MHTKGIDRRSFLKKSAVGLAVLPAVSFNNISCGSGAKQSLGTVAVIKTDDRAFGVREAMRLLNFTPPKDKNIMLKPNFNSADVTPGSTHNDTLEQLVIGLKDRGAAKITIAERSGPPKTQEVMQKKGIFDMSDKLGFDILNFEDLEEADWVHINPDGNHWKNGFYIPRPVTESEYIVSTCCLKTHGYGGHFTMSMKLAVGLTPKNMMRELHGAKETYMRDMIAEINQGYKPELVILEGVNAFVDGGPSRGDLKEPNVMIAGTDRVAVDAVGVAVLKEQGANDTIMGRKVFEQDQIRRAVEVKLGITSPDQINFVTNGGESAEYAEKLKNVLAQS